MSAHKSSAVETLRGAFTARATGIIPPGRDGLALFAIVLAVIAVSKIVGFLPTNLSGFTADIGGDCSVCSPTDGNSHFLARSNKSCSSLFNAKLLG